MDFLHHAISHQDRLPVPRDEKVARVFGLGNRTRNRVDILPALKDGDSHHWRSMSRTEKDI